MAWAWRRRPPAEGGPPPAAGHVETGNTHIGAGALAW